MSKNKLSKFIIKAKEIHGNKYDYSKVEYVNNKTKVCIICQTHREFWQMPYVHLRGSGCPKCGIKKQKKTTEQFIIKAKEIHGNKYDYSKVEYVNNKTKVCIICPEHGEFFQIASNHINNKFGCNKCGYLKASNKLISTTEQFIIKAKEIHGNKYDYSKVEYVSSRNVVCIICPEHGEFWQIPYYHLQNSGCPICNSSKGEKKIRDFLIESGIFFESQKSFKKCKNKKSLRFDFYLPKYNLLIEYDGIQHFKPIDYFGGIESYLYLNENDEYKSEFAKKNNIKLLRISYIERNDIEEILSKNIFGDVCVIRRASPISNNYNKPSFFNGKK